MLKGSSAERGSNKLLNWIPTNRCSRRDITSTPRAIHVLERMQEPTFPPLRERERERERERGEVHTSRYNIHLTLCSSKHSQWKVLESWLEEEEGDVVGEPGNKTNDQSNPRRVEPNTTLWWRRERGEVWKTKSNTPYTYCTAGKFGGLAVCLCNR